MPRTTATTTIVVKIEREDVDDVENVAEADIDEEFIQRYKFESGEEDNDDARDGDWSPDEDEEDWPPRKSTRKKIATRRTTPKKDECGSRSGPRTKLSPEEFREKEKERKWLARLRKKEENGGSGSSQVRTKLPPEEVRARANERKRLARLRQKEHKNLEDLVDDTKVKIESGDDSGSSRSPGGGRKRRCSEMTPEEWQAHSERERLRKQARKANRTPEEIEAQRTKERERARMRRAKAKEGLVSEDKLERERERKRRKRAEEKEGVLPVDKMEMQREKRRERRRARRAAMTPEQKREESQKIGMYRLSRKAKMTEEEKRELNMRNYMARQAKLAEMTPEEREVVIQKKREIERERARFRAQKLRETVGVEGIREMKRKAYRDMDPEKKGRLLESFRRYHQKRMEVLKQEPDKWKEFVTREKERKKRMLERRRMNGEELVRRGRRNGGQGGRRRRGPMTEEEREKVRETRRERDLKKRLEIQVLLDSGMTMEEIQERIETPEQRERRCIRKRIQKARDGLRARLRRCGATPEEIQRQVEELNRTYQPQPIFRPYKPRKEIWERVDPQDVAKLREEGKLDDLEKLEPSAILEKLAGKSSKSKPGPSQTSGPALKQSLPTPSSPRKRGRPINRQESPATSSSLATTSQGYPHLQPQQPYQAPSAYLQQPAHASYMYSNQQFQTTAHSTSLQDSRGTFQAPGAYHHQQLDQQSTTSSQQEYGGDLNSYQDDAGDYSPPPTPGGGVDSDFDIELDNTTSYYPPQQPPLPPETPRRSRPRAPHTTRVRKPRKYVYVPPKNPNAKLRSHRPDHSRDHICDTCGQGFASTKVLRAHQNQFHNPNYDLSTRTCRLCNESFPRAQFWYTHYVNAHSKKSPKHCPKTHMCDTCGQGFANRINLENHQYYTHGDGLKPENHLRCPYCPEEKLFNKKWNLKVHVDLHHPEIQKVHDRRQCYRCDKNYPSDLLMRSHVEECHPTSFFPCLFCNSTRFTKLGLNLHYMKCPRIPKEERLKMRKDGKEEAGYFGVDDLSIPCELCGKMMTLAMLTRHYKVVHKVTEDPFKCEECGKEFKRREFWAAHLEERHRVPVLEEKELLGRLNAMDREGMVVTPVTKSTRGRNGKFRKEVDSEEEVSEGGSSSGEETKGRMKTRRKVNVIAEEDEMVDD